MAYPMAFFQRSAREVPLSFKIWLIHLQWGQPTGFHSWPGGISSCSLAMWLKMVLWWQKIMLYTSLSSWY